jgi:lipopolysaccharide transport system ATP-binding protein
MALAIRIEGLSKYYRLGVIGNGTLWQDIQSYWARLQGTDDPNTRIGERKLNIKGYWALSDIHLDVEQGDRVGIMGRNGAGKSTLLKILSRITMPSTGCFHVNGRIMSLLEVGTGFHGELTGRENIYLNGAILGMKRREVRRHLDEIIEFSEIGDYIDTPVKRYSTGMYIRLGFAIGAHLECEIMIADEVLAVGDLNFQKRAIGKMSDLSSKSGRTVLFVSHNTVAVSNLCNKGVVLDQGKMLLDQCPVAEAVAKYNELMGIQ